jgi:hypothetical protein
MSSFDHVLPARHEAKLRYDHNSFEIVRAGDFVRCALTGEPIPLQNLRYWNVPLQEAYKDAATSLKRYLELNNLDARGRPR